MTDLPVASVQRVYQAFSRGDLPTVVAALSPSIEWVTPPTLPWSKGRYEGHAGVGEYFGSFAAALVEPHIEVQELLAADGRVVALGFERARVRATGRAFAARFAHVWTFQEGMVVRMEGIIDTATIHAAWRTAARPDDRDISP